jgi:hypothetical protein
MESLVDGIADLVLRTAHRHFFIGMHFHTIVWLSANAGNGGLTFGPTPTLTDCCASQTDRWPVTSLRRHI